MRSSTGCGEFSNYVNVGAALGASPGPIGQIFEPEKVQVFKEAVWRRIMALNNGMLLADPLKVFIKTEPHSLKKIAEGRFRLISGVSMVDAMVDRIIFGWLADRVLASVGKTPIRVGWTPLRGGWRELRNAFMGKRVTCIDKSSWDWTMQEWVVLALERLVMELTFDAPEWLQGLIRKRFQLLFRKAVFQFADGTQARQASVGVMKSGCFMTIIFNSLAQMLLHAGAKIRMGRDPYEDFPQAMGDDTVQETPFQLRDYVAHLEKLGCIVKGVKIASFIEFAGVQIVQEGFVPSYWKKHLFKLANCDLDNFAEFCQAMTIFYYFDERMVKIFTRALLEVGQFSLLVPRCRARALVG